MLGGYYNREWRELVKMKKFLVSTFLFIFTIFVAIPTNSHAQYADGSYQVKYQVNKPGSISASMANDYFVKPAKVIVKNGEMTVQLTIKNSAWVTEFNPPGGATVISKNDNADSRVVQFKVTSISKPLTVAMKIDIEDIDYHHSYGVDFVFEDSNIPAKAAEKQATTTETNASETSNNSGSTNAGSSAASANNATTSLTSSGENVSEKVENPQTNDAIPYVFIIALITSAFFFIRTKQTN